MAQAVISQANTNHDNSPDHGFQTERQTFSRRGRVEHLWILALALTAIIGALALDISPEGKLLYTSDYCDFRIQLPEICMSRRIFGISCPGCGLTHSFVAMVHGDMASAIQANPMGPILFALCWLQIPYRILLYLGYRLSALSDTNMSKCSDLIIWLLLGGFTFTWLFRFVLEAIPAL